MRIPHTSAHRGHDDDASVVALEHVWHHCSHGLERTVQVRVNHGRPLFVGQFPELSETNDTCIGHADIEPAEGLYCAVNDVRHCGCVANVSDERQTLLTDFLHECLGLAKVCRGAERIGNCVDVGCNVKKYQSCSGTCKCQGM
jgi:hypothetical protein